MYSQSLLEEILSSFLQETFRSDGATTPKVLPTVNRFVEWFDNSGISFFKFYTDHTAQHSLDVAGSGIELIAIASQKLISARDLGYFIVAAFCHDAGMHMTEAHSFKLVDNGNSWKNEDLDVCTWPELWILFIEEARRFSAKTLTDIFGDTRPISLPPNSSEDFTDRHRMLIGEFIRRNHPRLAHDLVTGLDEYLGLGALLGDFKRDEKDLIGLIARSHGVPLRSLFTYIQNKFDLRDYNRTHIIYLMGLLRIADFAQLQSTRAPVTKENIHPIPSPISQREWRVHHCIRNITSAHNDPEAVYVDANPENVADYLRLKQWLKDLQQELDVCWAVFGEVYGRQTENGLSDLRLVLRRVRSSIFEKIEQSEYIAEAINFKVAEAEMLALLLAPLYGDHPGYGLRELIQNAYDAVSEARFLKAPHLNSAEPAITIVIELLEKSGSLVVEDNGVGMTSDTLKSYFLNAGASFRSSMAWKKNFVHSDGHTSIARSGRFGVGALEPIPIMSGHKHRSLTRRCSSDILAVRSV